MAVAKEETSKKRPSKTVPKVIRKQTTASRTEIVLALPPVKAPKQLQGFVNFVRTQGVVGLAVGLVLGTAAKSVVDSLVANVFNPIIGLIGAGGDLATRSVCLKTVHGVCSNKIVWGAVVSSITSFIIVAALMYVLVMSLKLDKLDKPKPKP